jgi:hypothetical protein
MSDKNWFDALSEILSKPLPGTQEAAPVDKPVVFTDDDDDDSLLDRITDILSRPIPGTSTTTDDPVAAEQGGSASGAVKAPENPGETAVREATDAADKDEDPVSTTAAAGADWMQREYERFNLHQEAGRKAFSEHQRIEQERFAAYQRAQLDQFMHSQERERAVFGRHQAARSTTWRQDLRHAYAPPPGTPPGIAPPRMPPPPPPPPWWRKR